MKQLEGASLTVLRDEATRIAHEHGFTDATVGEDLMLIVTEVAEAMEGHRNGEVPKLLVYEAMDDTGGGMYLSTAPKNTNGSLRKPVGIPSEIADVIIRCLHFCGKHGIDIEKAVAEKMAYNAHRPFKNGGKKL